MDDELGTLVSAGAASLATAMASDAWHAIRTGTARLISRHRPGADRRAEAGESLRDASPGIPAEAAPVRCEQANLAHNGDIYAVSHGNLSVHLTTGRAHPSAAYQPAGGSGQMDARASTA